MTNYCDKKYNIPFINPVNELTNLNIKLDEIFLQEETLGNYNDNGHDKIL